jgi:glutamyl-tRNA reductase
LNLLALGLNHRTAPLDLREKLAIDLDELALTLGQLYEGVGQAVVLSTCNRLEVYGTENDRADLASSVTDFLSLRSGLTPAELGPYLYHHEGESCVRHLFRVSAGLDSMIVGESQILGQVRTAFSVACQEGHMRGPLSRLFHQALSAGRRVQRETQIGRHSRSVSQAAVRLARGLLGDLADKRVLVIGAGDAGQLVARALSYAGVREIAVVNRTFWRAEDLARDLGGVASPFEQLPLELEGADVVISSTGSPGHVLDLGTVREAMAHRPDRPALLIDIAVPRDIDPRVRDLDSVQLYDIDSLELVAEAEPEELRHDIARAEEIIAEELGKFRSWLESLDVVPVISAMREQAEEMRRAEVAKTLQKVRHQWGDALPDDCLERLTVQLEAMSAALVKKLLHHPTMYLRDGGDPGRLQLTLEMFKLEGSSCPPPGSQGVE